MHPALTRLDHRPWPVPQRRWTWRQSWLELLFAHWRVPAEALRPLVPAGLRVEEFDGSAWLGVVPFQMRGVTRRPWPALPGMSDFPELNLRTYVERDGKPGVWFFSLDADHALAVWAARRFFHLPYWRARITVTRGEGEGGVRYQSQRPAGPHLARFEANYRPTSEVYFSKPGTLEHFLTERYCMYSQSPAGVLYRGEVHHWPWPLQHAEGSLDPRGLLEPHGLTVGPEPPLLHYSAGVQTVIWSLERLG